MKHALIDTDLELSDVATGTGLSLSLVEKIASGHKAPSKRAVSRIEAALGYRIWSTAREYRNRRSSAPPLSIIEFHEQPAEAEKPSPPTNESPTDISEASVTPA